MSTIRVVKPGEHYGAVASVSWIDPACGLPKVDRGRRPFRNLERSELLGRKKYRFANYLEGYVVVNEAGRIAKAGFTPASGMYCELSFLGMTQQRIGQVVNRVKWNDETATFVQLVGARTVKQERLGEFVGGLNGGPLAFPLHNRMGRQRAEECSAYPPIWTEVMLTISNEGKIWGEIGRHSWFPSVTTYLEDLELGGDPHVYKEVSNYDATKHLPFWKETGFGLALPKEPGPTEGNPWGIVRPSGIGGTRTPSIQPPVRPWPMTHDENKERARRCPVRPTLQAR